MLLLCCWLQCRIPLQKWLPQWHQLLLVPMPLVLMPLVPCHPAPLLLCLLQSCQALVMEQCCLQN